MIARTATERANIVVVILKTEKSTISQQRTMILVMSVRVQVIYHVIATTLVVTSVLKWLAMTG